MARPVPTSQGKLVNKASFGNLKVALPVNAGCGYSDQQHLVVCLNLDYAISPGDQLRVLAFANDPFKYTAGSERALKAISGLIATTGGPPENAQAFLQPAGCTSGDCERRITLELQ